MSNNKRFILLTIITIQLIFLISPAPSATASETTTVTEIGGKPDDPLLIKVQNDGLIGVFAEENDEYQPRYFNDLCSSTALYFLHDGKECLVANYYYQMFLPPPDDDYILELESGEICNYENSIAASWSFPGLLQVDQFISYQPESYLIEKTFKITAKAGISELELIHGVDLIFTTTLKLDLDNEPDLLVQEQDFHNPWQVRFYSDMLTPWQKHLYGDSMSWPDQVENHILDDIVNPAGFLSILASWKKDDLLEGQVWSVTTYEDYTPESLPVNPKPTEMPQTTLKPTPAPTSIKEPTKTSELAVTPTPLIAKETNPEPKPESTLIETAISTFVASSSSITDSTTGTTKAVKTTISNQVATSKINQLSKNETQPVASGSDHSNEIVKTGESYAITFSVILLTVAVVLLFKRIKLNKSNG